MRVNSNKTEQEWTEDTNLSVEFYNNWYTGYAPKVFQETRAKTAKMIQDVMEWTDKFRDISPEVLSEHPEILPTLRMATCPPIARDRLVGLSGVKKSLVESMEKDSRLPPKMKPKVLQSELEMICSTITEMIDVDAFPWLGREEPETKDEELVGATIVADRLCGAESDPIIRNAQEKRQLDAMQEWLEARGYRELNPGECTDFTQMPNGTFSFRMNVIGKQTNDDGETSDVNIPVDAVIMRKDAQEGDYPALFEAKSAGDFTNTNKRRKEEAVKMDQLREAYGANITFDLFLCGYFNKTYLAYEKDHGIDWMWEHRIDDLEKFGF
ncbi:XamI family restriction endonuclease [Vibrio vulnificus]|nr:XamI family restriction endonuclease [Vibrio vulnificus]